MEISFFISHFDTAGLLLCEADRQFKGILFPVVCHIINKTAAIVVALDDGVYITAFAFAKASREAKYLHPCSMDCSVPKELGGRPKDSLDCITSTAVPPDSTCMMASR